MDSEAIIVERLAPFCLATPEQLARVLEPKPKPSNVIDFEEARSLMWLQKGADHGDDTRNLR